MPIQPGEPVYFLSLEMKNVGAFGPEGVRIDLSDGHGRPAMWTLILGENGVGKTTALECLLALTPLPDPGSFSDGPPIYARLWTLNGKYRRLLRVGGAKSLEISARLVPGSKSVAGLTVPGFLKQDEPNHEDVSFRISNDPVKSLWLDMQSSSETEESHQWPGIPIHSYRAAREIDFEQSRFPAPDASEYGNESGDTLRSHHPVSVDEWLIGMHHTMLAMQGTPVRANYDWLMSLLVEALPGVLEIRAVAPEDGRGAFRMAYLTEDGWLPYANLGLGYRSVMGLIGDLAWRLYTAYPESAEPLKEAAVVLIDEIDLHLHPTWQRKIIGTLSERFPNVQFIATAHSPLMVQAAAGHNLVLLRREGASNEVVAVNDVDGIANWRLDQIVTSELFGVPSAVRPQLDAEIERRDALLAKESLTDEDRDEIRSIEAQLGDVPLGETEETRGMNDLLRRTLEALEKKAAG